MKQEISKELRCIVIYGGIELWVENEKLPLVHERIESGGLLEINGEIINTKNIVGIFTPQTMEESTRRKNGEWKCKYNYWHAKRQECMHKVAQELARPVKKWERTEKGTMKPSY